MIPKNVRCLYLRIEPDEYVAPVPVEAGDPDIEVRLWLLVLGAIGTDILPRRYKTRLGGPIYLRLPIRELWAAKSILVGCTGSITRPA